MPQDSRKPRRQRVAEGIYRQDGALFASYREPGTGRQRMTKLRSTTTRAGARERASILAALREGRAAARSDVTVRAFCAEWLGTRQGRVSERTLEYDQGMVERITRVIGALRLQDVTVRDVRRLLAETATLAERTRDGMLATFRQVMKMTVDEGLIVRDPAAALQPHERPTQRTTRKGRSLSPDELLATIAIAERRLPGHAPLVVLLAYTGLRAREALALRWEDVDLDAATIRVRWQLAKDDRTRRPVKTEAGNRDVPVLPALRRRLIEHPLASP